MLDNREILQRDEVGPCALHLLPEERSAADRDRIGRCQPAFGLVVERQTQSNQAHAAAPSNRPSENNGNRNPSDISGSSVVPGITGMPRLDTSSAVSMTVSRDNAMTCRATTPSVSVSPFTPMP